MPSAVSAAEANRLFSRLLRSVREGHTYIITSHGRPVAKLVPITKNADLATAGRTVLFKRLRRERVVRIGHWKREDLYRPTLVDSNGSGSRHFGG